MRREDVLALMAGLPDEAIAALTLFGEVRGEPIEGQIAVAAVIRNRVRIDIGGDGKPDWWGEGYRGVCLKDKQFSCWNDGDAGQRAVLDEAGSLHRPDRISPIYRQLAWIARGTISGDLLDTIGNATHYHTFSVSPSWAKAMIVVAKKGRHVFYRDPSIARG